MATQMKVKSTRAVSLANALHRLFPAWFAITSVCAAKGSVSLSGQQVIELSGEDRMIDGRFDEVYRLGSVSGDEWDVFGRVASVAFDALGNLHILDTQAMRVSVVGPDGSLIRHFGREGEGPGEFAGSSASALELTAMRDGRTVVFDPGRALFNVFGPDGKIERTLALSITTELPLVPRLQAEAMTQSVLSTGEVGYLSTVRSGPDGDATDPTARYVMRYDLSGDNVVLDSVVAAYRPEGDPEGFAPGLHAGVLPSGGLAWSDSSAYAIKIAERDGSLSRVITRPFRPAPATAGARAAYIEEEIADLEVMVRESGGDPEAKAMADFLRGQIESMDFYHEIPVILTLRTSWDGTIWVRRRGEEPTGRGPIDLLTSDGSYLGTLPANASAIPSAFGPDGLVAFIEAGELDVQSVVVRRLPRAWRQ